MEFKIGKEQALPFAELCRQCDVSENVIVSSFWKDALEELDDRSEWDVDNLIIYDETTTPAELVRAVKMLTDLGESVRCERQAPEGLRCRKIKKMKKGVIGDVE